MTEATWQKRLIFLRDNYNFHPKITFDLGAFNGNWAKEVKKIFPETFLHSFEANEIHAEELRRNADEVTIAVIGDRNNKEVPFYRIDNTGDSILQEKTQWYKDVQPVMLTMRTIDSMSLETPDFVKIDLQGAELHALKGGRVTFADTELILLETKILEYNAGAPTFLKVVKFMDDRGYAPLDVMELHHLPTGELNEVDILFAKKESRFFKKGDLA